MRTHATRTALLAAAPLAALSLLLAGAADRAHGDPMNVSFSQSARSVPAHEFVEVSISASPLQTGNPFTDVVVRGQSQREMGAPDLLPKWRSR